MTGNAYIVDLTSTGMNRQVLVLLLKPERKSHCLLVKEGRSRTIPRRSRHCRGVVINYFKTRKIEIRDQGEILESR